MTELEKEKRLNRNLKEAVEGFRYRVKELKQDVKDLQQEIQLMATLRRCPALQEAAATIKRLEKQLEEHKNYERNSLIKE